MVYCPNWFPRSKKQLQETNTFATVDVKHFLSALWRAPQSLIFTSPKVDITFYEILDSFVKDTLAGLTSPHMQHLRSSSCDTSNKLISQRINIFARIFQATSNLCYSIVLFAAADINANSIHYKSLIPSQGCRPVRNHDQSTYLCILFCHSWLVFTAMYSPNKYP